LLEEKECCVTEKNHTHTVFEGLLSASQAWDKTICGLNFALELSLHIRPPGGATPLA